MFYSTESAIEMFISSCKAIRRDSLGRHPGDRTSVHLDVQTFRIMPLCNCTRNEIQQHIHILSCNSSSGGNRYCLVPSKHFSPSFQSEVL